MSIELITKHDLEVFRIRLLHDIKLLLETAAEPKSAQQWLKNKEVMALLKVSANTVQRLRVKGVLRSSKIGGVHYYKYDDLLQVLKEGIHKV